MAGTLFGIGLSQQVDSEGVPISGALLYIYQENSSTPVTTYSDFSLTQSQTWPLEADSAGRLPGFWVADGSYRARLTTAAGIEVFDEQSITAIGASSGGSSSGSAAQDTTTLHQTGDFNWQPVSGTRSGWARCNGRAIGSGASGAAERANSDTQAAFEFLWNTFSDTLCPVSGGRGGSAAADFNANKTIGTLDMRSKAGFGMDGMGNSAASVTGGSDTAATAVGASTYTIVTANLPSTTLTHSLTVNASTLKVILGTTLSGVSFSGGSLYGIGPTDAAATSVSALVASTLGGNISLGGSGTHLAILTNARVGTWYMKL